MTDNIIVLGYGLLGSSIVEKTKWNYISRKKDGFEIFSDINFFTLNDYLKKYDVIINCIAYTNTYDSNKENHWLVNYKFVVELVNYCKISGKKLIHISTDYIYANSINNATEEDIPVHFNNWYSYTKLLSDGYVQLMMKDYLLIRTSHKPYPFPYKMAWENQYSNGDYVHVISELIIKLIILNETGIYNVGTYSKNWYDLTKEEFKTIPICRRDNSPENITMNVDKLKNILS